MNPRVVTIKRRVPIKKIGKRGLLRAKANRALNKLGIHWCELHLPGCNGMFLAWAHSRKGRNITDWMEACRADQHCHALIESMPEDEMHRLVVEAIQKRNLDA